jgi:hypothetical protein
MNDCSGGSGVAAAYPLFWDSGSNYLCFTSCVPSQSLFIFFSQNIKKLKKKKCKDNQRWQRFLTAYIYNSGPLGPSSSDTTLMVQ